MNDKLAASYGQKIKKIEKFVNWEIEFKKGSSDIERIKALSKVEKYIIEHLFKENPNILLFNVQFTINPNLGKDRTNIAVDIKIGESSTQAVPPPKPGGGGPGKISAII